MMIVIILALFILTLSACNSVEEKMETVENIRDSYSQYKLTANPDCYEDYYNQDAYMKYGDNLTSLHDECLGKYRPYFFSYNALDLGYHEYKRDQYIQTDIGFIAVSTMTSILEGSLGYHVFNEGEINWDNFKNISETIHSYALTYPFKDTEYKNRIANTALFKMPNVLFLSMIKIDTVSEILINGKETEFVQNKNFILVQDPVLSDGKVDITVVVGTNKMNMEFYYYDEYPPVSNMDWHFFGNAEKPDNRVRLLYCYEPTTQVNLINIFSENVNCINIEEINDVKMKYAYEDLICQAYILICDDILSREDNSYVKYTTDDGDFVFGFFDVYIQLKTPKLNKSAR